MLPRVRCRGGISDQMWCQGARLGSGSDSNGGWDVEMLKVEVAALRECLIDAGMLTLERYLARLHRVRFSAVQCAHPLGSDVPCMSQALESTEMALAVASHSGPSMVRRMRLVSRGVGRIFNNVLPLVEKPASGTMYLCGGFDGQDILNTVVAFDSTVGQWRSCARMASARSNAVAAVVEGRLYVCGGSDGISILDSVECLDLSAGHWESVQPMSTRRLSAVAASTEMHLYVCGGREGSHSLDAVERLNCTDGQWQTLPSMSSGRSCAAAAFLGSHLVVCGGEDSTIASTRTLSSAESYDVANRTWTPFARMLSRRSGAAAVSSRTWLQICGGSDGSWVLDSVERYDRHRCVWESVESLILCRLGAAAAVLGDEVYICGGLDDTRFLATAERHSVTQENWNWERAPPMSDCRGFAATASF